MQARQVTAVDPFAFRLSASVCIGVDSYILETGEGGMSVVLSGVLCCYVLDCAFAAAR